MSDFIDNRPIQETLVSQKRPEKESRIDRGGSDEFSDDRENLENSPDSGEQDLLVTKTADRNQKDLTGDIAGENPEWSK